MRALILNVLILLTMWSNLVAQDCFMPPDRYTLYTTTNAAYNPPSVTGFITLGPHLSGDWTTLSTTGTAGVSFIDDDGRTSTLEISGLGNINIENIATDINTLDMDTCQQLFTLANYVPFVAPNPALGPGCPINITIVIDESESIGDNMSDTIVRDAVIALVSGLNNTGSQVAIVEFDSEAERVSLNGSIELQEIDDALITALDTYLTNDYDPMGDVLNLIGGTNWEDALTKANDVTGTDLVLMITDGRPTFYTTVMGMNGIAGEGLEFDLTALKEAQDIANTLKTSGKRIFVAGLDFPTDIQPLRDISGNIEYLLGQDVSDLLSSDYTRIPPASLVALMTELGQRACIVETIPTMGQWAVINVGLVMLILGVVMISSSHNSLNHKSQLN